MFGGTGGFTTSRGLTGQPARRVSGDQGLGERATVWFS